jgi:hypothetical protein
VRLVVSSLLAGIGFGDRVPDLKRSLDLLPSDLPRLYEKMIVNLDPFYLEHAVHLFPLVSASAAPMDLVFASFADEDDIEAHLARIIRRLSESMSAKL